MNLKKLTIVLALLLTMFAIDAKAINIFGQMCAAGSRDTTVKLNICGTSVDVRLCFLCPTYPPTENFSLRVLEVTFAPPPALPPTPGCNWDVEITNALCNWSYIQAHFCPGWPVPEPCINGYYYIKVDFVWPLCMYMHLNMDNSVTALPCEPKCCICTTTWKYCYEAGILHQIVDGKTIGTNPYCTDSLCATFNCSTIPNPQCPYTYSTASWPTPLNPDGACFHLCE